MSNEQTAKAFPTHRIYAVSKDGEKTRWTEIGAAWPHKDGKGFQLKYTACPLGDAEIVLRAVEAKTEVKKSSRRMNGRYDALRATGAAA
jgi:hypothetical protein